MPLIPIYKGGEVVAQAQVDEADSYVSAWRWGLDQSGYARRTIYVPGKGNKRAVFMHRLILGLEHGNALLTDHVNGDKLDNRRENLRAVTNQQNQQNRVGPKRGNSTGFRGVCKGKTGFRAYCGNRYLGWRKTAEEAAALAEQARRDAGYLGREAS